jgi:RNA polymerase sigma-70 factor (ECF subfamily)
LITIHTVRCSRYFFCVYSDNVLRRGFFPFNIKLFSFLVDANYYWKKKLSLNVIQIDAKKLANKIDSPNTPTDGCILKMTYSSKNDKILIRLVARHDPEAFSTLYDRYKTLVFSLAVNIVSSPEAAEDVALDVFTKVWEKADTYRPEKATVKRWISSITRYRSIDTLRRRSARPDSSNPQWSDFSPDSLPAQDNPEEAIELAMIRREVTEAVSKLPEEQKEPLALAYFKGYTHSQIAEILNEPLGTIKTRIRLALQRLRRDLKVEEVMN